MPLAAPGRARRWAGVPAGMAALRLLSLALLGGWSLPAAAVGEAPAHARTEELPVSTPEAEGMSSSLLTEGARRMKEEDQVQSVLVLRNGRIVHEYNRPGVTGETVFPFFSCTKSVLSVLVGIAVDEGALATSRSLGDGILGAGRRVPPELRGITVRHLLSMTSGLDWPEGTSWGHFFRPMVQSDDWVDFILGRRMAEKPGARFNYSTGDSHLLSAILQQATGRTALEYGREVLFDRIGMTSVRWDADPRGINVGGSGLHMTTRDAARFASLVLNAGRWRGQQIVSAGWIRESTSVQSNGDELQYPGGGRYGHHWWIRELGSHRTVYAWGAREQYVFVTPDLDLVAVFAAAYSDPRATRPRELYRDYVIRAVTQASPP